MHKTCLKMHLMFVCTYRKKVLVKLGEPVKDMFLSPQEGRDFKILVMEVDRNHIHVLIEDEPKQESTRLLWNSFSPYLSKCFWRVHTLWSDGYFASSVGDVSASDSSQVHEESRVAIHLRS